MENANDKQLSFPQRNWLLLCIIVAILSPLVVHWVHGAARKRVYTQETEVRDTARKGGDSAAGGATDTSNKVASPANTQPNKGAGGTDSARH
jgi:hypothetical protein